MKTWEYLVMTVYTSESLGDLEARLDDSGQEGWELVQVVEKDDQWHCFFKRLVE